MSRSRANLIGKIFGRLKVLHMAPDSGCKKTKWFCRCDCGQVCSVFQNALRKGRTKSCGCLLRESSKHRMTTHGHSSCGGTKTQSPTYGSWRSMRYRCYYPKSQGYEYYGDRGIKVCERWLNSFENFLMDMGDRPEGTTLDRIDNNGNYEPDNCRWSSVVEQNRNRRCCV